MILSPDGMAEVTVKEQHVVDMSSDLTSSWFLIGWNEHNSWRVQSQTDTKQNALFPSFIPEYLLSV